MKSTVALVVTGSIAAYKAPAVARLLSKAGIRVIPIVTRSATEFVGRATFSGLTGERVVDSAFGADAEGELHVELGKAADLIVVVPATADFIARLAQGRADDLATATCLCARGPILLAPAMHPRMWDHPATKRNVNAVLADSRAELVGPVRGEVASGDEGMGRMAESEAIAEAVFARLARPARPFRRDLEGRHVVVSAGPTIEDIDPVRFIGNRSTGKMGFAVAERAALRGARVTLVSGPVGLATPPGVHRIDVRGALSMKSALWEALGADLTTADALVMTAAVGDYRPREASATKLKRDTSAIALELVPNPDLLAEIGAARRETRPVLVAFAVETEEDEGLVRAARSKLRSKGADFVVANAASDSFGRDDNRAFLVDADSAQPTGILTKLQLADRILDRIRLILETHPS
ncbi:MAG: bifunctional phosphopantothenoylcysteine decarboxylase/phosphopantothenate--cysteine ligase CoaBC [Polyangiaceae bacterium]|nr:bifunctional phosphopantothenoylcysteine decarboxylase/phosphopantothenate--cysteine ligase CoaBC [Polyangiaceae bacterium]